MTAMPDMLLVGLIASCVYAGVDIALGLSPETKEGLSTGLVLLSLIVGLMWNFFITPIFIAVHRYIVLGEITPRYRLAPSEPRFLLFFGWSAVLSLGSAVPVLLGLLVTADFALVLGVALIVLFFIASVRLIILFPAIAIDAPGADWRNAWADSRGNFWRIFGIIMFTMLPLILAGLLLMGLFGAQSRILIVISSVIALAGGVLGVAAASRLYQALARRLDAPAGT